MSEYWFDASAADKVCEFFERYLVHSKGEFADKPFILENWQREFVREIFGWKNADGLRRYREVYLEIPRKNGKSTLCAGLALYLLFADGEPGAEVYSAAADTDQARIVFEEAKSMVFRSPALARRAKPYKGAITHTRNGIPIGSYRVLSSEAGTKHGLNASGIVIDELHAQTNRELYDVLNTSLGSRRQPLSIAITTAGWDRNSLCYEVHDYAEKVLSGVIEAPRFLGRIYGADKDEDWTDPEVWRKANPNLGVSLKEEFLSAECKKAREIPTYENTFRMLYLNQWVEQETRFIPMDKWDACDLPVDEKALEGRTCYAGLDLSTRYDLTALSLVFPPVEDGEPYRIVNRAWIPESAMLERIRRDKVPYNAWVSQGLVLATPGDIIDHGFVRAEIEALGKRFRIAEVGFDRWGAVEISTALIDAGFNMIEFGQGMTSMSSPTKELLALILAGKIAHGGNPVLRWAASSMTVKGDAAGNIKPVKPDRMKSANRIDPIVALIMALDRAMRNEAPLPSVYEKRGILAL